MNELNKVISDDQEKHFRLMLSKELTLGINISWSNHNWEWNYALWDKERYEGVKLENEQFVLKNKTLDVTKNFYEFIRLIKCHPKYRLRIIQKLDNKIRPIWNKA